ncbi:MAG TPA: NEW3 domain-containing protein [Dehalococcoidales bacterium]|nr:NEW3 domain-containing protein [Dehalococcoidales bacterium]
MRLKKMIGVWLAAVILMTVGWAVPAAAEDPKTDLVLMLTGGFSGTVTVGQESLFYLALKNTGETQIENITFGHDAPAGLQVRFRPDSVAALSPGSSTTVDVIILADKKTDRPNYHINLVASSPQIRTITTLYFSVSGGSSYWVWVGLGIGILAVIAFVLIYRRMNK